MKRPALLLSAVLLAFAASGGAAGADTLPDACKAKNPVFVSDGNGKKVKQGQVWLCHPNGAWKLAQIWEAGKKHGKQTAWYENGKKKMEVEFREGKIEGKTTNWHENGKKVYEGEWRDDKKHGKNTTWYDNGKKQGEGEFRDGKQHGKWTIWYENGKKKIEAEMQHGKEHGLAATYHENGKKSAEFVMQNGKTHGLAFTYHENGNKRGEVVMQNGIEHGRYVAWGPNGNKTSEGVYVQGVRVPAQVAAAFTQRAASKSCTYENLMSNLQGWKPIQTTSTPGGASVQAVYFVSGNSNDGKKWPDKSVTTVIEEAGCWPVSVSRIPGDSNSKSTFTTHYHRVDFD
jgi:antitoxin component YwqK of YwqJK toxin-antitoxin module